MNNPVLIKTSTFTSTALKTAGFACCLAVSLLFFSCEKEKKMAKGMEVKNIEEVFPKYRRWASPSGFIKPETNPPSLLWPVSDGRDYTIRMSLDSTFAKGVISQKDLPWAMYNPHQKLKAGTWYWQHRSGEGDWSERSAFIITEDTPEFVTPEFREILHQIPASHPRVLLWEKELETFRKGAAGQDDSRLIINEADRQIVGTMPDEQEAKPTFTGATAYQTKKIAKDFSKRIGYEVMDLVEPVCQAYLLTGDQKYVDAILLWTRKICSWDPEGPTSTSDFGESKILYGLALIFDSFYEHLPEDDKNKIISVIKARGAHFYDDWPNYLEAKVLSNHVWQFNLYRIFMTALAVHGELPEAEKWLEYIYEVWLARSPVLGGNDGGWVHGVSYYHINTVTLLAIPSKLQEISGVNFIRDPFYQNNTRWLAHAYPPHSTSDGFGDGSEGKYAPDLQILGYMDAMARINQDTLASWYVEESLQGGIKSIAHNKDFRWFRLRRGYSMEKRPGKPDKNNLPLSAVYPDVGMAYMHTNLNDHRSNLMVAMRSSPYGSHSHMHADQNTFNIAYGGKRLFFNSGYKVSMSDKHSLGWYKATQGHNGILIDGKGSVQSASGWGWLPRALHGSRVSYVVGDASNAYDGESEEGKQEVGLEKFRRHILMLRPHIIVVYDELETCQESTFSWLVHSQRKITLDNAQSLFAQNGTAVGEIILTGSQPLDFNVSDAFAIEPVNFRNKSEKDGDLFPDQWHFKANSTKKAKKMRFLAIIQVTPEGAAQLRVEQQEPGKYTIGGWQIEAALNVTEVARLSATKTDQTAAFTSAGILLLNGKSYERGGEGEAKLLEIIDGEEIIQSVPDRYPPSFHEANFHSNKE